MDKITFLGPFGATFSHEAYVKLAERFGAPKVTEENYIYATKNRDVLPLLIKHGGYGAIAMETLAEGRVAEPVEAFISLMDTFQTISECPFKIFSALRMNINFCLMARVGMTPDKIQKVIGHTKAFGACRHHLELLGKAMEESPSNGKAAEDVARIESYAKCAALGPRSAAEKYGLNIMIDSFEDWQAITTFFLLGPKEHDSMKGEKNRSLVVFKTEHKPGALVNALIPFRDEGINLMQIHSVHAANGVYNFAIEVECDAPQLPNLERAMRAFEVSVSRHLSFGPFVVL